MCTTHSFTLSTWVHLCQTFWLVQVLLLSRWDATRMSRLKDSMTMIEDNCHKQVVFSFIFFRTGGTTYVVLFHKNGRTFNACLAGSFYHGAAFRPILAEDHVIALSHSCNVPLLQSHNVTPPALLCSNSLFFVLLWALLWACWTLQVPVRYFATIWTTFKGIQLNPLA